MAIMNNVSVIGNIGADPVLRQFTAKDGTTQNSLSFTVCAMTTGADSERANSSNKHDWFAVTLWRNAANAYRFLKKGMLVAVEGPVHLNMYQSSDGQTRAAMSINNPTKIACLSKRAAGDPQPAAVQTSVEDAADELDNEFEYATM